MGPKPHLSHPRGFESAASTIPRGRARNSRARRRLRQHPLHSRSRAGPQRASSCPPPSIRAHAAEVHHSIECVLQILATSIELAIRFRHARTLGLGDHGLG